MDAYPVALDKVELSDALDQFLEVRNACHAHRTLNALRMFKRRHQSRIPTEARTDDTNAVRVGDAFIDQPVESVEQVFLHFQTPLAVARAHEVFAIPDRTAIIWLQHRISSVDEKLSPIVKFGRISGVGTAVGEQDRRHGFVVTLFRHGQISGNFDTVSTRIRNGFQVDNCIVTKVWILSTQQIDPTVTTIVEIESRRDASVAQQHKSLVCDIAGDDIHLPTRHGTPRLAKHLT